MTGTAGATQAAALADPQTFARGEACSVFRHLRAREPLAWTPEPDGPGFWSVTRYAEGAAVLKDASLFSSVEGTTLEGDRWEDDPAAGKMLPLMAAPAHGALRRILMPHVSGQRVEALQHDTAGFLARVVEECTERGCFEVGDRLGTRVPMHVAFRLLGLPSEDEADLLPIVRDTLSCDETLRNLADAELLMYVSEVVEARRRQPADDAISAIISAEIDGRPLEDEAVLLTVLNVMSAGLTTTRLAITGTIHALLFHPDQWRWLQRLPDVPGAAIEEILRWTSPAAAVVRTAHEDTTLAGRQIRRGQRVAVWIPSLNADETVFTEPDRLRLDRSPNRHLGFGTGMHACLGMMLARLELRLLLSEIRRTWTGFEADGPAERLGSLVLQGIDRLPVRVGRV
jgi:cytochrome P450